MGEKGMSLGTRRTITILTLIGGIGALLTGLAIKIFSRKVMGIALLAFGGFMASSRFQANVLSIASALVAVVGITLLVRPMPSTQNATAGW
jgi:hypothetical protein